MITYEALTAQPRTFLYCTGLTPEIQQELIHQYSVDRKLIAFVVVSSDDRLPSHGVVGINGLS